MRVGIYDDGDDVDNVDNVDNVDIVDNVDNLDDESNIQQEVYRWFTLRNRHAHIFPD